MAKVYAFIADGMEEVECLSVCDLLVRAGVEVKLVSVMEDRQVVGSHGFKIQADELFADIKDDAEVLFLPGGLPGTNYLKAHKGLSKLLKAHLASGRRLAAICAAPSVLGQLGLARDHRVTCFPGYEREMTGAVCTADVNEGIVTDGLLTTGRGLGWSLDMGLELIRLLVDEETSLSIKEKIQYRR